VQLERARYLVGPKGRAALEALPPGLAALTVNELSVQLRRQHPPDVASALAEQVTLRARARGRFSDDYSLLLTADGLEMMTHPTVAARRAARLAALDLPVADLTCGLGGDLRAIVHGGTPALGLERDAATALLAQANVPRAHILQGDARQNPLDTSHSAVLIDPSRRAGGGRRFDPVAFSPPWDRSLELLREGAAGVMKAPPGIEHRHIPPEMEAEFVQLGRSMREAALWCGQGAVPGLRRAVLLPAGIELDSTAEEAPPEWLPPNRFVYDPESCVTRAGLVRHLGARLSARLMDSQVAYLTSAQAAWDPLSATFEVLDVLPFSLARLRDYLRAARLRPEEIRRRAFPVEPDELRRLLGRLEGDPVTLLLTTIASKRLVFVARRVLPPGAPPPAQ